MPKPGQIETGSVSWEVRSSEVRIKGEFPSGLRLDELRFHLKFSFCFALDLYCYLRGEGRIFCDEHILLPYTGERVRITAEFGQIRPAWPESELNLGTVSDQLPPGFQPFLERFVRCLRLAKTDVPHDTSIHCHRAIEALRKYFVERDQLDEAKSWELLRRLAGFTKESYRQIVGDFAKQPRHGGHITQQGDYQSANSRQAMIRFATDIGASVMASLAEKAD